MSMKKGFILLLAPFILFLNACGGDKGGNDLSSSVNISNGGTSGTELALYGLDYSPYVEGEPGEGAVKKELYEKHFDLFKNITRRLRFYGCDKELEPVIYEANKSGYNLVLSVWLDPNKLPENTVPDMLKDKNLNYDTLIVGNEWLLKRSGSETKNEENVNAIVNYIKFLKKELPGKKICYSDIPAIWKMYPELIDVSDETWVNIYPYWENVPLKDCISKLKDTYEDIKKMSKDKKIVIGETGYPSVGKAGIEESEKYYNEFKKWANENNISYFYFEAVSEPWKQIYEGISGPEWGLLDKDGNVKFPLGDSN